MRLAKEPERRRGRRSWGDGGHGKWHGEGRQLSFRVYDVTKRREGFGMTEG
jgi:hypothetical protein